MHSQSLWPQPKNLDELVQTQSPCTSQEIDDLWKCIYEVDSTVLATDTRKEHLKAHTQLQAFLSLLCTAPLLFLHKEVWCHRMQDV